MPPRPREILFPFMPRSLDALASQSIITNLFHSLTLDDCSQAPAHSSNQNLLKAAKQATIPVVVISRLLGDQSSYVPVPGKTHLCHISHQSPVMHTTRSGCLVKDFICRPCTPFANAPHENAPAYGSPQKHAGSCRPVSNERHYSSSPPHHSSECVAKSCGWWTSCIG